jgi:hypothetical protein
MHGETVKKEIVVFGRTKINGRETRKNVIFYRNNQCQQTQ